jgi:flagellar hook protein FlgE
LTGFGVDSSGKILTGLPVKMSISAADYLPKATTTAALSLTLDIRKAAIPTTPVFNAGDPSTYTHSTTTSVYDASGTQVDVQTFYVKRSATTWDVYGSVGGNMLSTNAGLMGTLTFNSSGVLASSTTPAATPVATKSLGVYTVPVGASSVNFDMSNTVQFGTSFAATMTQDGSPPGQMVGYKMSTDGVITASYSNGQTATMGQVVLASFKSADGLASAANNQWLETTASGQASLNTAGAGGLGILQASATEDANVDLTSEMIKMISAQRVFQAAAEMVKKQDQIMQTVVNIGQ